MTKIRIEGMFETELAYEEWMYWFTEWMQKWHFEGKIREITSDSSRVRTTLIDAGKTG
ncbi:MAG: hypothetical protein K6T83_21680 [Alicyclobacillus sp.]|nr:hypothetical protein [Alicyclobacillus sp.]